MFLKKGSLGLSSALVSCLKLCYELLPQIPPRKLFADPCRCIVYTDASWQRGRTGTIAGVLIDLEQVTDASTPEGLGILSYWKYDVHKHMTHEKFASFPINVLESIAPTVSVQVWGELFRNSRVEMYIDNSSAQGCLIRMNSGKPHLAVMSFEFWRSCSLLSISPYIDRVPSADNIADLPTKVNLLSFFREFFNTREVPLSDKIVQDLHRLLMLDVRWKEILIDGIAQA
ncbi:unnamed protein product [Amoebophrya sp. A25]|nr:unnamed protein product [Amoebophrya sp. A25]|eukprot:GSA25T00019424001.1